MSKWLLSLCVALLSGTLIATDADAGRLGGSRSLGTQRNVTTPPASTPAKPAQQQAAPAQQQAPQTAPQPAGSRWMPILGGLALGGLLGYLFSGSGLGVVLLLALLAVGLMLALRAFSSRRAEAARPMQYAAGLGEEAVAAPPPSQSSSVIAKDGSVPTGFDAAGFLRAAKLNFVKLQVANDAGQLEDIREFTTREMFDELRQDILTRGSQAQQTDVVALNADLLEVATESNKHWASVRFSGMVRETPGTAPVGFEEVWNLVKPADGSSGWLLAGIQQMH
ncbi:MAG TPA: Tim44-like domain-containing protein [Burkholderiales bacterium]|nr:Tim44-like domain-containing protein [Burkholderiales bacterium]